MDAGEYWQRRFEQYDSQARSLLIRTVEIVSIGLTVLGAVMGLAIASDYERALAFIPPVVLLLWAVAARFIDEQLLVCAYRDYAELQAACHMGVGDHKLASWWQTGAPKAQKGFVNYYLFILLAVLSIVLIGGSLYALFDSAAIPQVLLNVELGAIVVAGLFAAFAFLKAIEHHREACVPVTELVEKLKEASAEVAPAERPHAEVVSQEPVGSPTGPVVTRRADDGNRTRAISLGS